MVAAYLEARPDTSSPEDVIIWLQGQGYGDLISGALLPVLSELWVQAWQAGTQAANQAAGGAAAPLPPPLTGLAAQWISQIAFTTLRLIAAAMAAGGKAGVLIAAVQAVLGDPARADQIAMTEIVRLMAAAAEAVYRLLGIRMVRWLIEDDGACPACKANFDQGPHPLGVPFSSGALIPPDHVRCRCALVPA